MGGSQSTIKTGLGGVSPVFPIGSYVRVPRALTYQQVRDAADDMNSPDWSKETDVTIGRIGLVIGGGKLTQKFASVAFMVLDGSVLKPKWWNMHSSWLEAVPAAEVSATLQKSLQEYMHSELGRMLVPHIKSNINEPQSKWGPAGSVVRVCGEKPSDDEMWSDMMERTLSMIGIVVTSSGSGTLVVFPSPICFRYVYKDEWLSAPESQLLDAETDAELLLFHAKLLLLQKTVLAAVQTARELAASESTSVAAGNASDSEDSVDALMRQLRSLRERLAALQPASSAYARIMRRFDSFEERLAALESKNAC